MPLVEIEWFKGRDDATRVKTIDLVTKAVREGCECSPEAVTMIIQDIHRASWCQGGKPFA